MGLETLPTSRVFYPTRKWKRLFAFFAFVGSLWLLISLSALEVSFWKSHLSHPMINILLGIGIYLVYLLLSFFILSWFTKPIRHIITSEGIIFCSPGYRIYTPWNNIRGAGTSRYGSYRTQALLLQEPAVKGAVQAGVQLEKAMIERRWLLTGEKAAPDDAIPLLFTVPANWQESELGLYVKQYAPQAFSNQV